MLKFIIKLTSILTISSLVVTALPGITLGYGTTGESDTIAYTGEGLSDAELAADNVYNPGDSDIVEFTLDVRWGYVHGNKSNNKSEKNYDGSVSTTEVSKAKFGLVKKLLFDNSDSITSERNPVSWISKIYSHWDGVMVHVLSKGDSIINVKAGNYSISKSAREWFALGEPAVHQIDGDEMLVVKINKKKHRRHGVIILWGIKDRTTCNNTPSVVNPGEVSSGYLCAVAALPVVDFSGSISMDTDSAVKLKRTLRFEDNDSVDLEIRSEINWISSITTGRDGLYTFMLPNRNVSVSTGFTIEFFSLPTRWTKHYSFEDVQNGIRETIEVNGEDYVLLIGRKHIAKQLVKARLSKRLYLIEDDVKHEVDNNDVLAANGLNESDAVEMDDDELETFDEGDKLNYPDGSVVEDGENTYIIENGQKRRLATQEVINRFIDAKRLFARLVSAVRLNRFGDGAPVTDGDEITDESLIKVEGNPAVWRVRGNKRQVFTHLRIFNLHKLKFDRVKTVTQAKFNEFDWTPPVKYPDGALIKTPTDPKVYLIKGGLRHWIETEADLKSLGYNFSDIADILPSEITQYDVGDPVLTD